MNAAVRNNGAPRIFAHRQNRKQDKIATLCGKRTAISQRRAQQRPATPRVTDAKKKAQGEGGRPGNDALPAKTRGNHVRCLARAVGSCGRRGAAQQRGPHLCAPQDRSEKREQRYVATRCETTASCATTCRVTAIEGLDKDMGRGLPADRRGATTRTRQDRRETCEQRDVVRGTARSQRRTQQHPATQRAKDAKQRGSKAAGRATRRCRRSVRRLICDFGPLRGQLWTPRRGATALTASLHAARPARDTQGTRATRCGNSEITASCSTTHRDAASDRREEDAEHGGRPDSKALPAENREKGLRI